jgi:hypothetical protein
MVRPESLPLSRIILPFDAVSAADATAASPVFLSIGRA